MLFLLQVNVLGDGSTAKYTQPKLVITNLLIVINNSRFEWLILDNTYWCLI